MLSPVPVWLHETPQVFSTATPHGTVSVLMLQVRSQNCAPAPQVSVFVLLYQ
jgi:hypothetical protein